MDLQDKQEKKKLEIMQVQGQLQQSAELAQQVGS
jgi:hypothetical protein